MTALAVLVRAKFYIQDHGWCQGMNIDRRGRVCLDGALRSLHIEGDPIDRNEARRILLSLITAPSLMQWNDNKYRRKSEVLTLLDVAIDHAARETFR